MSFPRPALATKTRTAAPGFSQTAPGQIVKYQPPGGAVPQQPTRLIPEPYRPTSTPPPRTARTQNNDVIDAEVVQTRQNPQPKRRTVQPDGKKSSEVQTPERFPQYPNPADNFKTVADWQANAAKGLSKKTIDEEREAYEFTKDWGKTGGILYPFTENGPRTPIISDNFQKANNYRARNGLPAIDRFGYEQAPATHPDKTPARDFQSNPFKQPAPKQPKITPYTPTENPYNFDNDPETGLPYTESQKRGAEETGRPPWHINPETGRPWNDPLDNPGTPIPLPFNGAPGGGLRFPSPVNSGPITGTWNLLISAFYSNGTESQPLPRTYRGFSTDVFAGTSNGNGIDLTKNGQVIHANWTLVGTSLNINGGFTMDPQPANPDSPEFTPIGSPVLEPTAQPSNQPQPKTQPQPQPQPAPDPRLNPTKPSPTPTNPNPKPTDHPSTPSRNKPAPAPAAKPTPQIPGQPGYNPGGNPGRNPGANPEPARPSSGKGTNSNPENPPKDPKDPTKDICEEPCIKEMKDRQSEVTITIKIFDSCKLDANGKPDYFKTKQIKCAKSDKEQLIEQFATLAEIQSQQCKKNLAIATVPEWWAVRVGADRPQLVIMYRSTDSAGSRYTLTIPHYMDDGKPPKLISYQKGSVKCEIELKDNSKIRVYAQNEVEGKKVLYSILKYVNSAMIDSRTPTFKKESRPYKQCEVKPERADYYSTGSKNMEPDARYYF